MASHRACYSGLPASCNSTSASTCHSAVRGRKLRKKRNALCSPRPPSASHRAGAQSVSAESVHKRGGPESSLCSVSHSVLRTPRSLTRPGDLGTGRVGPGFKHLAWATLHTRWATLNPSGPTSTPARVSHLMGIPPWTLQVYCRVSN